MTVTPMINVRNLVKTFQVDQGAVRALQGVDFTVEEGEFFTLLGPSGSGKSTTIRCVAGLEQPDAGEISIGGDLVYSSERQVNVLAERRPIGMVFQSYAVWPHMNVFDNVAFPLRQMRPKPSSQQISDQVMDALRVVQLEELAKRPVPRLSGGQQQRVALARALVRRPRVLLLDEPLSNLDAKLREEMRWEIRDLTRSLRISTLYVTHDQVEALSMSDRIGVIIDGALVEVGSPLDLYLKPRTVAVAQFLGGANIVDAEVVGSGPVLRVRTGFGDLRVTSGQPVQSGSTVKVMIRPESLFPADREGSDRQRDTNILVGRLNRSLFVGSFVDAEVSVGGSTLRIWTNVRDATLLKDEFRIALPPEGCWVVTGGGAPTALPASSEGPDDSVDS
jgi:iron(III) transport system ATP-binding protein